MKYRASGLSVMALAAGCAVPALAQDNGAPQQVTGDTAAAPSSAPTVSAAAVPGELADIVVTAQRRTESAQRAALAITAVSGEEVANRGVTSTEQLSNLTAGLQVQPAGGPYTTFTIRSVTQLSGNAFADPSVAVNINGVYLATPTSIRGLYYDIERLEILKGPQGTLYGRNATAGAINILSNRPKFRFGANLGIDVGNYDHVDVNAAINLPLSDRVAFRLAGQIARHDGYMSDGTNDEDVKAMRASLLVEPSSNLSILLTGDYAHESGRGAGATLRKPCATLGRQGTSCFVADPYTGIGDLASYYIAAGLPVQTRNPFLDNDYYGLGLNVDWTTPVGIVSLVGGYRKSDVRYVTTATSWQIRERQKPTQKSLELRLASPSGERFQYVIGGYYLDTEQHARANGENALRRNFSDQRTNLYGWTGALFTQLSYALTETFRLTGGVRYTYEEKRSDSRRYTINTVGPDPVIPDQSVGAPVNVVVGTRHWNKVNWKAGVELDAAPRSLLYANVSTGFKAGGFYYGPAGSNTYEPERVTSYVVGSKNRFLNNRLQLNAEAFYLDYRNQQVSFVKLVGTSSTLVTENAGKSRAYGAEVESEFLLTPTTQLSAQAQYLNARYKAFSYLTIAAPPAGTACSTSPSGGQVLVDCSGLTPLRSPRWTLIGRVEQSIPLGNSGKLIAEAGARHETKFQNDVSYVPLSESYATTRVDLGLSYVAPSDAFTIKAYVDNLTKAVSITDATQSNSFPLLGAYGVRLLAPRTYGIRAQFKF